MVTMLQPAPPILPTGRHSARYKFFVLYCIIKRPYLHCTAYNMHSSVLYVSDLLSFVVVHFIGAERLCDSSAFIHCRNGGYCVYTGHNTMRCRCPPGYYGLDCSQSSKMSHYPLYPFLICALRLVDCAKVTDILRSNVITGNNTITNIIFTVS